MDPISGQFEVSWQQSQAVTYVYYRVELFVDALYSLWSITGETDQGTLQSQIRRFIGQEAENLLP